MQVSQAIKEASRKIVGFKQTLRAIQQDQIREVFIASDVEDHIVRKITDSCREKGISLIPAGVNQKELGRLCKIEVGAAMVGIIK